MNTLKRRDEDEDKNLFFLDRNGKRQDKGLHDEMLDTHPGPHQDSIDGARKLGLTDKEIKLLYGVESDVKDYNPNHGPDGRFTSGSGGGATSAPERGSGSGGGDDDRPVYSKNRGTTPTSVERIGNELLDKHVELLSGTDNIKPFLKALSKAGVTAQRFMQHMLAGFRTDGKPNFSVFNFGDRSSQSISEMTAQLLTPRGKDLAYMDREIDLAHKRANHALLEFADKQQGKGVAANLMAEQVGLYKKLGLKSIEANANIDVGGYAWAKYGYLPDSRGEWTYMQWNLRERIEDLPRSVGAEARETLEKIVNNPDPRSLWAVADHANGKDLLLESTWSGRLDLTDNATMRRFNAYVRKKRRQA